MTPDSSRKIVRIALVQTARDMKDKQKNFENAEHILSGIRGVDMVVFPENWAGAVVLDEKETDDAIALFSRYAKSGGFIALTGSLFIRRGPDVLAVGHVIRPDGALEGFTEKIFPSFPVGEREFITPGARTPLYNINGIPFGIIICVDLFYPEIARSLALRGARILFNPSNIPKNRIPLWSSLVTARAAENTVYVAFTCNTRTTYPDARDVAGHSMLAAPWGDILFEAGESEGVFIVEADLSQPSTVRERWPYLDDIRALDRIDDDTAVRKPME